MTRRGRHDKIGRLPNFLIIGAPRAGTTSLAKYLGAHPQVFVAPHKEVRFFDTDSHFARGTNWYRRQFAGAKEEFAVGEASPNYMVVPSAAERIGMIVPDARLIVVLRDPIDRALSHYLHNCTWWGETRSFQEAVLDELRGSDAPMPYRYLHQGRYVDHIQRFLLPRDNCSLQVVFFEDLRAHPAAVFFAICGFLGVDASVLPANVGRIYNSCQIEAVSPRLFLALKKFRRRPGLPSLLARGVDRVNLGFHSRALPTIPPALEERLTDYFAEPNARLGDSLGLDVRAWWAQQGTASDCPENRVI